MIGSKRKVGNDVNGGTGVCAGVIASGRGGCQATQTVSMQSPGYGVRPPGRGGGKAIPAVNLRNPCRGSVGEGGHCECWYNVTQKYGGGGRVCEEEVRFLLLAGDEMERW